METENKDAETLNKIFKENKDKNKQIINILAHRKNNQRQKIKIAYNKLYHEDLVERLKKELKGSFDYALTALFEYPIQMDCFEIYDAFEKLNEKKILEIISTRPKWEMEILIYKFKEKYRKDLLEEIEKIPNKLYKKLVLSLLTYEEKEPRLVNDVECQKMAKKLMEDGKEKWIEDNSCFFDIIKNCSPTELLLISKYYSNYSGESLYTSIKNGIEDDKDYIKTALKAIISPCEYFAEKMRDAIINFWSNDKNYITRLIISRKEIDLKTIKKYYIQLYQTEIERDIERNCNDDPLQQLLLELVKE